MMDPMSALSVATSLIAFVDFGGKLVSRYFEIKKNGKGVPLNILALTETASEVASISTEAKEKINALAKHYPQHANSLSRLSKECLAVEAEIEASMIKLRHAPADKITLRGSKLFIAIRSLWSDKQVLEWGEHIDRLRNQVMVNVLMCFW
jgi:hypothetical protein